ncbi:bifunctional methylenetetrahydrofolate dehydrogenase/methenyltetrahydrofolate cyclohydrolase FolD [Treponema sp. J25]|uniref:bifunctional methylenetetrahydrofolate dehydrogenase/methenyltetrahydrofolate cyclohydrolase FolD n=1 Tax=Treponema sp. J25 TaxID=2094121 RepID=UPI0010474801|nr:bifunctional methylenetetrahydrofolate dehydrogenase/methenyltetrahydrofolate cyclohydrolase FolD [Treponema sp. J25]TCW62551.1 bifunctional methylenetetrahydrofolate dehydrogenase/methenyltetrahydrofolate cyclohydrolase FolD [Treponema sp. J25]
MAAQIIDGKEIARKVRERLIPRVANLQQQGVAPCLAVILVGTDPASVSYVTAKERALAEVGMTSRDIRLPADTTEEALLEHIRDLNGDPAVHGILVQLPLPSHIDEERILMAIDPAKDVDGFHPLSVGNMVLGRKTFLPCTPHGVLVLLRELGIPTKGAHAVVVGRSNIVGRPLANLLSGKDINATVTVCHTGTRDLASFTRQADILIAAVGRPHLITADMVKPGAVVIDVGVNRVEDPQSKKGYRLVGDVDFDAVLQVASYITPVPGGVGPMTIAMLLQNVLEAAESRLGPVCR